MQGWVKLYRKLINSYIFNNDKLLKVWIWCLCKATHKDTECGIGLQKVKLKPGQFVTGRTAGSKECGMTPTTFWRYLNALKEYENVDIKSYNKYSVVTVVNWESYQEGDRNKACDVDNKWTTSGQQVDTNKNDKNVKKKREHGQVDIPYREIIAYLNKKTGRQYRVSDSLKGQVNQRWREGYRLDDFRKVVDIKCAEWTSERMVRYLRPSTLFGTKFGEYLQQGVDDGPRFKPFEPLPDLREGYNVTH